MLPNIENFRARAEQLLKNIGGHVMQPHRHLVSLLILTTLLALPACAKMERAAARSGAAVQRGTAKVEHGAEKVGDKIGAGMDETAEKLGRAGHKVDQAAKRAGEKLPQ